MACDEQLAATLRAALSARRGFSERAMFGGIAFMLGGHMVCGVYRDRAMFRVGRDGMASALALPGVERMAMGGRPMAGYAEAGAEDLRDPALREALTAMALEFVAALPPK